MTGPGCYRDAMDWGPYFIALSTFAGVVFSLTLVARHLPDHRLATESARENLARKWDSSSVTFELAGGGLFSVFYLARQSVVSPVFATLVGVFGLLLYFVFILSFVRLFNHERARVSGFDLFFAGLSVVPMAAFASAPFWLWQWWLSQSPQAPADWFAAACTWLVFSGTTQAILWYLLAWADRGHPDAEDSWPFRIGLFLHRHGLGKEPLASPEPAPGHFRQREAETKTVAEVIAALAELPPDYRVAAPPDRAWISLLPRQETGMDSSQS